MNPTIIVVRCILEFPQMGSLSILPNKITRQAWQRKRGEEKAKKTAGIEIMKKKPPLKYKILKHIFNYYSINVPIKFTK